MDLSPAPPFVDPLDGLLGYQLRRASAAAMGSLAAALARLNLKMTEASILMVLGANPDVTQSEIGRRLAIKRANMTPLVSELEARGLVERSPVDGRSQALRLTRTGAGLAQRVGKAVEAQEEVLRAALGGSTHRTVLGSLRKIRAQFETDDA